MRSELGESPAIVDGLLDGALGQVRALAREVAARHINLVVIAARGTSDHAALYGPLSSLPTTWLRHAVSTPKRPATPRK